MQKLLKKSPADFQMSGKVASHIHHRGDKIDNDEFHAQCDWQVRKYNTVVPVHTAPSPPTRAFLENYDEIDWGHKEEQNEIVPILNVRVDRIPAK